MFTNPYGYSDDKCDEADHRLEYQCYMRDPPLTDDAATEVDETKSISSEATLLGVQEEKGKSKEYEGSIPEDKVEEIEPTGCLSGLFGGPRLSKLKATGTEKVEPKSGTLRKLASKLIPSKIKIMQAVRHKKKVDELFEQIHDAAMKGTLYTDTALLDHPLFHDVVSKTGILGSAASAGNVEFVKFLLARGAPVDGLAPHDLSMFTPLGGAILNGKPEVCEELIKAGAKFSGQAVHTAAKPITEFHNNEADDALPFAVRTRRADIVRLLLKYGAFDHEIVKAKEEDSETSFHLAASRQSEVEVLKAFTENEQTARYINFAGGPRLNTPLHYAIQAGDLISVKLLVEAGANLEVRNIRLCTPLHWAIKHHQTEIANYLIDHAGADIEAPRVRLETPLKYAVCNGNRAIVSTLLAKGAKADAPTCEGKFALHSAAAHESHDIVNSLLRAGASINCRSAYGSTPLYLAAQNGRIASAKLLLEHGADTKMGRTSFGSTKERDPMSIAKKNGNWEIVKLLECWERGEEFLVGRDFGELSSSCSSMTICSRRQASADDLDVEDHADNHECSWEYWFEKYIVRVYENESSLLGTLNSRPVEVSTK
jgi:ankyrin repeat protein